MKVKDIFAHLVDNYYEIVVETFDSETNLIKNRYYVQPHSCDFTNIPEDVWETEVGMIVVYYNSLVISVKERKVN